MLLRFFKYLALLLLLCLVSVYLWDLRDYNGVVIHQHSQYGRIEISRDKAGIPHIKAKTLEAAVFGQGYTNAQDRLFQIILKTKLAKGQVSEISGEVGLPIDTFFRTLGIHRVAKEIAKKLKSEDLAIVQAYCDGINFYYHSLKLKPLEFVISGVTFEEFTPIDVIVNERLLFVLLGYDYLWEPTRTNLASQFGFETAQFMTGTRSDALFADITVTNDEDLKKEGLFQQFNRNKTFNNPTVNLTETQKLSLISSTLSEILYELFSYPNGSNAWVIHGNHTQSGKPLLANDPHLQNSIPATWLQAEILIENENIVMIGSSIPGLPMIQNGRTNFASWGTTVLFADTSDLYKEKIEGNRYFVDGEWKNLRVVTEEITVKGRSTPQILEVKHTHRGPLMSFKFDKFSQNPLIDIGMEASLAWNGDIRESTIIESLVKIARSSTLSQLKSALGHITGPALSVVYATTQGDIGFYGYGRIPVVRDPSLGAFIKDGTTTVNDWQRYTTPQEAPQVTNPSKGFVVTANNRFSTDNINLQLSVNQISTSRSLRITQLIEEQIKTGKKFTIEDMKRIQQDKLDSYAQIALPQVIELFEKKGKDVLDEIIIDDKNKDLHLESQEMINLLKDWDYQLTQDSYKSSIFMAWEYLFSKKCLHKFNATIDEREGHVFGISFEQFYFSMIRKWNEGSSTDYNQLWCQTDQNSKSSQPCLYNLFVSFAEIKEFLSGIFGSSNPLAWRWGTLHKIDHPHTAFARVPILGYMFNRQNEGFGNRRTVAVSVQNWRSATFDSVYGANFRMVIDMDDSDNDQWILDTGIAENVFSQHYDDQMRLHAKFEYLPMRRGFENFRKDQQYFQVLVAEEKGNEGQREQEKDNKNKKEQQQEL